MIEQAWSKFFSTGWDVNNVPDKRECFVAGFNAAMNQLDDQLLIQGWHRSNKFSYDVKDFKTIEDQGQESRLVKDGVLEKTKMTLFGAPVYIDRSMSPSDAPVLISSKWHEKFEGENK